MRKLFLLIPVFVLVIIVLAGASVLAGPKVYVGKKCHSNNPPSAADVDHSAYDALLKKYVDGQGMVAYAKWKASPNDLQVLDQYLVQLGCVAPNKPASKAAKLAFWINSYNAVTIKGILREYPTTSIKNHTAKLIGYNIWKDLLLWVNNTSYSLDDMEHKILRKMGEPRIHFALVCASKGCPPLVNQAYTEGNVESLLVANAKRFFANPINFRADSGSRTIQISQLFNWYGSDFASTPVAQVQVLRPYFPNSNQLTWIDQGGFSVSYLPYDWSLNDQ